MNKGFALFVAVIVTGTLLLVSLGIVNLAVRQAFTSGSARESQYAFYAADTGIECVLYWDVKNPPGYSAFATTSPSATLISCNKNNSNLGNEWSVGGSGSSAVTVINRINFLPDPYCTIITVTKNPNGTTRVESLGYNTCDPTDPRRVERAVRATY